MASGEDDMFADSDNEDASNAAPPAKNKVHEEMFSLLAASRKPSDSPAGSAMKRPSPAQAGVRSEGLKRRALVSTGSVRSNGKPVTVRCHTVLEIAAAEDRGTRTAMEDVWVAEQDARLDKSSPFRVSFCGVFDGHGGRHAAQYVAQHLHESVLQAGLMDSVRKTSTAAATTAATTASAAAAAAACTASEPALAQAAPPPTSAAASGGAAEWEVDTKAARASIVEGFRTTDARLLELCAEQGWAGGATAVVAWVCGETVLVANVGDARAVLARRYLGAGPATAAAAKGINGGGSGATDAATEAKPTLRSIVLTKEHKCIFSAERERIERCGGAVANGRLEGRIEVSRAFGDRQFKRCGLSCSPDVTAFRLTPRQLAPQRPQQQEQQQQQKGQGNQQEQQQDKPCQQPESQQQQLQQGQPQQDQQQEQQRHEDLFLLLACDGFFSVFSPDDASRMAAGLLDQGRPVKAVCDRLINEAVRGRRAKDNVTLMLLRFLGRGDDAGGGGGGI